MPRKGRRRKRTRRSDQEVENTDLSARVERRQQGEDDRASGPWKFHAAALLVICSLGTAIYSNGLNGVFVFNDFGNITGNRFIIGVRELDWQRLYDAGFKSPSARPVANISFALNRYFGGFDVTGYHVVNIVIHLLAGLLVYFLASVTFRLFFRLPHRETVPAGDRAIAWMSLFAACIFVAHPLQTQAVTYIVQRMTSVAAMFYLLALLLYVYGRLSHQRGKQWALWTGCLISWMLALGSKEIAATLPLLIVLYEWYFFQDLSPQWLRRSSKYFLALAVVLVLVTLVCLGTSPLEQILSGYDRRDFSLGQRVLTQQRLLIYYIGLVLCPLPSRLNLWPYVATSRSLLQPITTLFSLAAIAGLVGLAVYLARRQRLLSFCILWFFLNLAIESSVIALEMVYQHRLYLPMFAFALAVPYLVYCLLSKRPAVAGLVGVVVILSLGTGTYARNRVWRDEVVFYRDVIAKNPLEDRAHNNLGNALRDQGKLVEALELYRQALRIKPDSADTHNNLGNALARQGKFVEASAHFRLAFRIMPGNELAHNNLALALERQGKIVEAMQHYHRALQINPDYALGHNNLGNALARQGKTAEAIDHYRQALRIDPDSAGAHNSLGLALTRQGKIVEAREHFQRALQIKPDFADAYYNLGNNLNGQGNLAEAIEHYRQALRIKPDFAEAHNNLGNALARQGKIEEAIEHYRQALRIKRDYAEAHNNLGLALAMQASAYAEAGRFDRAIETASNAIDEAAAGGNEKLAREIRRHVESYRQGVPHRKPSK